MASDLLGAKTEISKSNQILNHTYIKININNEKSLHILEIYSLKKKSVS